MASGTVKTSECLYITGTSVSDIYSQLNELAVHESKPCRIEANSVNILTNSNANVLWVGVASRANETIFDFLGKQSSDGSRISAFRSQYSNGEFTTPSFSYYQAANLGTWATVSDNSINTCSYMTKNGIGYLRLYDSTTTASFTTGSWTKIGTLPSGARPSGTIYGSWFAANGKGGEVEIYTNGEIRLNPNTTGKQVISCSLSFPLAF